MLKAAAAKDWGVPASEVTLKQGTLSHASGKTSPHGAYAAAAAAMPVPEKPPLKEPAEFIHIGKGFRRLDTHAKSHGERLFTLDQKLPGMHVAVLARSPKFGGKVAAVDDAAARAVPGVVDVVRLPDGRGGDREIHLAGAEGPRCAEGGMGFFRRRTAWLGSSVHGISRARRHAGQGVRRNRRRRGRAGEGRHRDRG